MPELTGVWSEGWLWLNGSLLLAALWTNLAWFFRQPRPGAMGEFATPLIAWRFSPWLLQLLRLLYYIGVPFAVLLWGHDAVVGRLLGLQQLDLSISGGEAASADIATNWLDWAHSVGWAVALGIGTWGLLALGWWTYRRALATAGASSDVSDMVVGADSSGWVLLREAAYHEVHWAFYRNAPILAVDTYWGIWVGLALVALEATLNPAWRKGLATPQQAPAQLMRGALAVVSGALFLLTRNLWLALALHWGVSWGLVALARGLPLLSPRKPDQAPTR
jgi:hypothetical protein